MCSLCLQQQQPNMVAGTVAVFILYFPKINDVLLCKLGILDICRCVQKQHGNKIYWLQIFISLNYCQLSFDLVRRHSSVDSADKTFAVRKQAFELKICTDTKHFVVRKFEFVCKMLPISQFKAYGGSSKPILKYALKTI